MTNSQTLTVTLQLEVSDLAADIREDLAGDSGCAVSELPQIGDFTARDIALALEGVCQPGIVEDLFEGSDTYATFSSAKVSAAYWTDATGNELRHGIIREITAERFRQIYAAGHQAEKDLDLYAGTNILGRAAAVYAAGMNVINPKDESRLWPWGEEHYKPKSQREDLIKAAALIIAQIEVIDKGIADTAANGNHLLGTPGVTCGNCRTSFPGSRRSDGYQCEDCRRQEPPA